MSCEIQKTQKSFAVQIKNQALKGKDPTAVTNLLTACKQACDSLRMHEGDEVWLFPEFMNGHTLANIKVRMILFLYDANRHEGTITTYAEVVNYRLGRYGTDTVTTKADDRIRNSKPIVLTPWEFSKTLWANNTVQQRLNRSGAARILCWRDQPQNMQHHASSVGGKPRGLVWRSGPSNAVPTGPRLRTSENRQERNLIDRRSKNN